MHCAVANDNYALVIPSTCFEIRLQVRTPQTGGTLPVVRWFLKRDPNVGATPVYDNELEDDTAYVTKHPARNSSNPMAIMDQLRLIDDHVLWLRSSVADYYIEVLYTTGY